MKRVGTAGAVSLLMATLSWGQIPGLLRHNLTSGHPDTDVSSSVVLTGADVGLLAISFGLTYDDQIATLFAVSLGPDVTDLPDDPEFFAVDLAPAGGPGVTVEMVLSTDGSLAVSGSGPKCLFFFTYHIHVDAAEGMSPRSFTSLLGDPPVPVDFDVMFPFTGPGPGTNGTGIVVLEDLGIEPEPGFGTVWFPGSADATVSGLLLDGTVGITVSGAPDQSPTSVAVDPVGFVWTGFEDTSTVLRCLTDGTVVDTTTVGARPSGVALDTQGNLWVSNYDDGTLTKIGFDGQLLYSGDPESPIEVRDGLLGQAISTSAGPRGLAADPLDNVYVANDLGGRLSKHNAEGGLLWAVDFEAGARPFDVALDREEYIWVSLRGEDRVERRASDGSLVESFELPGAGPEALVVRGASEAWVVGAEDGSVRRLRPGEPATSFALTSSPSGLAVNGEGRLWVTDSATDQAIRFDVNGAVIGVTPIGSSPRFLGDSSGIVFPNALRPEGDDDKDSYANGLEIDTGANPFVTEDTPLEIPTFVPPAESISCDVDIVTVTLTWELPDLTYDSIEIVRDGAAVATLPGDATSYADLDTLEQGLYQYQVTGVTASLESFPTTCAIVIGPGQLLETGQVDFEGPVNLFGIAQRPGAPPGEACFFLTDASSGAIYATDADYQPLSVIPSPFLGSAPTTGIAFDPTGNDGAGSLFVAAGDNGDPDQDATIIEITLDGQMIGNPLVLIYPELDPAMGQEPVKGGLRGLTLHEESRTLLTVGPDLCELFAVQAPENSPSAGTSYAPGEIITGATALHPDPAPGLNGIYIQPFAPFDEFGGRVWTTGVGADGNYEMAEVEIAAGVATLTGATIPLGAASDLENVLGDFVVADDLVEVVGITSSTLYSLQSGYFLRGDIDGNGRDIGDPIQILQACFGEEPLLSCHDAYDVDDNGVLDVADPVMILEYLFGTGPPPSGPFLEPGPDPTPDDLPCL